MSGSVDVFVSLDSAGESGHVLAQSRLSRGFELWKMLCRPVVAEMFTRYPLAQVSNAYRVFHIRKSLSDI